MLIADTLARNGRELNPIIRRLGLAHYIGAHAHE